MRPRLYLWVVLLGCLLSPACRAEERREDGFLVAQAVLDGREISAGTLFLYQDGRLFAPVSFLTDALRLPFVWQEPVLYGETPSAKAVTVDFASHTVVSGGKSVSASAGDFARADGEWYIGAELLGRLLGVEFETDFSRQTVFLGSRGRTLPDEIAADAAARRAQVSLQTEPYESAPWVEAGPSWRIPFLDLNARYNTDKDPSGRVSSFAGYSAHAFAPAGPADAEVYVYDMDNHSPAVISLKASRYEPDGKMLGLFKKAEAGDIFSFANSAVNYAQSGRGIKLSTYADEAAAEKSFNVREPLPLGWDVELYRNGELLGVRGAESDGFFEFRDIPFLLGRNVFKLVFYGPQGQVRSEERVYFYTGNVVDKGALDVKFNFIEKNKYLVDLRKDVPSYAQGYNGLAGLTYGVTDWLSAGASAMYDSVERAAAGGFVRQDKWFFSGSLSALAAGAYLNAETVYDPAEGAWSLETSAQTQASGWDVALSNIYYDGTVTQRNVYNFTTLRNEFTARVNKDLALGGGWRFPFSYSFRRFSTAENKHQTEHDFSLYQNTWRGVYAGVSYRRIDGMEGDSNLLFADINHIGATYSVRGEAAYDFLYSHLYSAGVSAYKELLPRLTGGVKYMRLAQSDLTGDYVNRYSANLSWKTRWGYWTADFGVGDDDTYYGYLGVNLSLLWDGRRVAAGPDKLYGSGAVRADIFFDANGNGVRDEGEENVPGASAALSPRPAGEFAERAGKDGVLFTGLKAYEPYVLNVDVGGAQESASFVDASGARRLRVRPGQLLSVPCPVIGTGDAEGTVFVSGPDGNLPRSGIILKLIDEQTGRPAATRVSEFDGHYLFEKLPMGSYRLETDPGQLAGLGFTAPPFVRFSIRQNEEVVVRDVRLGRTDAANAKNARTGETGFARIIGKTDIQQ